MQLDFFVRLCPGDAICEHFATKMQRRCQFAEARVLKSKRFLMMGGGNERAVCIIMTITVWA